MTRTCYVMSAHDPKRTCGEESERHGRLGAGGVLLDRVAEAAVIEELERRATQIQHLDAC